jgi:hypothetical protein
MMTAHGMLLQSGRPTAGAPLGVVQVTPWKQTQPGMSTAMQQTARYTLPQSCMHTASLAPRTLPKEINMHAWPSLSALIHNLPTAQRELSTGL